MLLAHLSDSALDRFFREARLKPLTGWTLTDESQLRAALAEIAEQGWALLDREYEPNMRAIAAPVRDYDGTVAASIGCMRHANGVVKRTHEGRSATPPIGSNRIEAELGARNGSPRKSS